MNVGTRLVEVWFAVTLITRALVSVPFGLALLALAGWIVWRAGSHWYLDLFAAWLAFQGSALVVGSLAGFVTGPNLKDPSARAALRRSGMLGES